MDAASLAVIGAGPKAAAIAARVAAIHAWRANNPELAKTRRPPPTLHIFERGNRAGIHWTGDAGYTDGDQEVCTPPEADLVAGGSPYGKALDLAPYAWAAFVADRSIVNPQPTHRQLADYIAWALDRARTDAPGIVLHTDSEVTSLRRDGASWAIATRAAPKQRSHELPTRFDGVVITSPGPAFERFHIDATIGHRVYNGRSYWEPKHREDVIARIKTGHRVAVIGGGGAAVAICVDALRQLSETQTDPGGIVIIAPQATLFTRGESQLEAAALTDVTTWTRMPWAARRQIAEHLVTGVVFRRVLDQLDALTYHPEFAIARVVAAVPHGTAIALWCLTLDDRPTLIEVDRVVDASGFDPLWFVELLEEPARSVLRRYGAGVLAAHLDPSLRLVFGAPTYEDPSVIQPLIERTPALHTPFLAGGSRPPGRASLLQLGVLAAEIVGPYLS